MTLVYRGISREKIEIPLSVYIPNKNAASFCQNHRKRMIVMGTILFFQFNKMLTGFCLGDHIAGFSAKLVDDEKTQDSRHKIQDTRFKTQDSRHKIQDIRFKT